MLFLLVGSGVQGCLGLGALLCKDQEFLRSWIFMGSIDGRPIKSIINLITWFIRKENNKNIFTYFILLTLPHGPFHVY